MSEQDTEGQPPTPPPPARSRWKWALALPVAIPVGLIGTYFLCFGSLFQLERLGYITEEAVGDWIMIVMWGCYFGVPLAALGAFFGGLISWPLAKFAARRWGVVGALLAGILAGVLGALLVAAGFVYFVLL